MRNAVGWPKNLKRKSLKRGGSAFYWEPHKRLRDAGCPVRAEALGQDFQTACQRAALLNIHLEAWREGQSLPPGHKSAEIIGTVMWWHAQFFAHEAFLSLGPRSQVDYREALTSIGNLPTALTDARTGGKILVRDLSLSSITPAAADKIYKRLQKGGAVKRQANLAIDVARRAWKVLSRLHPGLFLVPMPGANGRMTPMAINPFHGVTRVKYDRDTAIPATRDEALRFLQAATDAGHPALGVAALICFEWHQRPEDVRKGRITWTDYRPADRPTKVGILHHKTRKRVWKMLETTVSGCRRRLYPELEEALLTLPRLGVPIVMFMPQRGHKGTDGQRLPKLYSEPYAQHLVQSIRAKAGLPSHFTLEACRHGGMTELGDAELTEQEVMTLSTHATPSAARLYVKRNEQQEERAASKRRDFVDEKTSGMRTKKG